MAKNDAVFLAYRVATPTPLLEVQEAVFHQMPQPVQRPVIVPLFPPFGWLRTCSWAVSPGSSSGPRPRPRFHWCHSPPAGSGRQQVFRLDALN